MPENTVHVETSREAVRQIIARLPEAARSGGLADAMMTRIGLTALGRIRRAFIVKARGGTDEAGDRWQPLSPKTIAYSRTRSRGRGGRSKAERGRASRPSQALNVKQQNRWWEVYRQALARHKGNKSAAAKIAWFVLKKEGAETLVGKYGHRQVEILRDTGLLLNSLSPGAASEDQIFRVGRGEVIVGTNRKGALGHHNGIPGKLPQRRLWPEPAKWPSSWWQDIMEQAKDGLLELALSLLRGNGS